MKRPAKDKPRWAFISSVAKVDGKKLRFDADRTGMGWQVERRIEGKDTMMPTTCKMERPR